MEAETEISEQPVENEEITDAGEAAAIESEPTTVTTQSDVPELEEKSDEKMEIANVEPTYSLEDMEEIRKWWEIPCVAHFCSLFRAAFDLPDFDIEELEEALLASGTPEGSMLMCDLISQLLNGCYGRNDIKAYNFEVYLKDIFKKRSAIEGAPPNPLEDSSFQMLQVRTKLELLQELSDFRLDAEDVQDLLKGLDGDNLRVEPMGRDQHGATYWYFYGVRLYKEDPELKPEEKKNKTKRKPREKKEKEVKKKPQAKQKQGRKKRRGRPAKSKDQDSTPATPKTPVTQGRKGRRGRPPKQKPKEEADDSVPVNEEKSDAENNENEKDGTEDVKIEIDAAEQEVIAKETEEENVKGKDEVVEETNNDEKKEDSQGKEAENVECMDKDGDEKEEIVPDVASVEVTPTAEQKPARRSSRIRTPVVPLIPSDDEDQMDTSQDETPRRTRRISRRAKDRKEDSSEDEDEVEEEEDNSDTEIDEPQENGKEDDEEELPLSTLNKEPVAPNRWHLVCQSLEDWEALAESFKESKVRCEKTMYRTIVEDFLPEIPRILEEKERDMKRRALENAPRRTSGRLEEKQKQREEEEKLLAAQQAEEDKLRQEEEEARRRILESEKLEIQKRQREEREKQRERMKEEREKAVERRAKRAALREERVRLLAERERLIAEGIELPPELQNLDTNQQKDEEEDDKMDAEKEELYSSMRKILYTIKAHEDSWPFWEPVKEEFAPDYFKYITTPMDLTTIERKLDEREYTNPQEFADDFQLLFDNCEKYNGENSDFTYMARTLEKIVKMRMRKLQPKRIGRYDADEDFIPEEVSLSPGRPRTKRQTAYSARENIHAVYMDQDEDGEDTESNKSKYTIIYPALKSRGDDMRTAEGQARFLQALQAAKRKEAAEEVRHSGDKPQRSLMVQTNTITIPKQPGRISAVDDPVKGIIVQNNKNKVQLLSKTVSVTSRYNGQKQDDEDPELASLPMHKRIKEREAQKAKLKLGEPKAEPVNDFISVVRRSEVSRLYSGLIQKTAKHASPQKHQTDKAAASPNISPKVVHISLDDFKRLQSQQAKVIVVPSRDKDKSGTVIHLSTGSCSTSIGTKRAETLVNKVKQDQSAKQAQGVVETEDVNVLEHSDDKVTVLKTTPVKSDDVQESSPEVENKTSEQDTEAVDPQDISMETSMEISADTPADTPAETPADTPADIADKVESSPEVGKVKKPESESKTYAKSLKSAKMSSVATSTPKRIVRSQKKSQSEEVKTPPIPKTIINLKKKTALQTTEKKKEKAPSKEKTPKTVVKKNADVAEKTPEESPATSPKTIMKGKRPALKTQESGEASKTSDDIDSGTPRKKLRKSVSWSKTLTTESPYVPPPATKEVQTSTPISTRKPPTLYKDGIHSRIPRMHRAPIQAPKTQEPPIIGAEKTIVNGMIVSKSMLHSAPVIKTYSKKEPERKRSYESDFFVEDSEAGAAREPSPPKLTRIEQIEGSVADHSEEAPPDIVSDHEKDDGQLSDSETVIQLSTDALRQTEITKLHTTLFTYTGSNQRQKKPKSPIKPVDDENTCAKVVRRTKRRLASPLHDSSGIRKPGRPANLLSFDSQITMDRMDAAKVRRSGTTRLRQYSIQDPVLDTVSSNEDVEEQEQEKKATSPSKRLKKTLEREDDSEKDDVPLRQLRSRKNSEEKQEYLREDAAVNTEMPVLETEDQGESEVNTEETESLGEKEQASIDVQTESEQETKDCEEIVNKSSGDVLTEQAEAENAKENEKSVEQDIGNIQNDAVEKTEKMNEQIDQSKSVDEVSKYDDVPDEVHASIDKVAVNILTGEEEIIEDAEQHEEDIEEEVEEEEEEIEEEKETACEIEGEEEMEENQDEDVQMEEELGPPELTAEVETLNPGKTSGDKGIKDKNTTTNAEVEPEEEIEDVEKGQSEIEEFDEEKVGEDQFEEEAEEISKDVDKEENIEVEVNKDSEKDIKESEQEEPEEVDEKVEGTEEISADENVDSNEKIEDTSVENEELVTEGKNGRASDEENSGDKAQEVNEEGEEVVESAEEEVEETNEEVSVEQSADSNIEKDSEGLDDKGSTEEEQTEVVSIASLSKDKNVESESKLEEGSQGEETVAADEHPVGDVIEQRKEEIEQGEENIIGQHEEEILEIVYEQAGNEREDQQESIAQQEHQEDVQEEAMLLQQEDINQQNTTMEEKMEEIHQQGVELKEECKKEVTDVQREGIAGQSEQGLAKNEENVYIEDEIKLDGQQEIIEISESHPQVTRETNQSDFKDKDLVEEEQRNYEFAEAISHQDTVKTKAEVAEATEQEAAETLEAGIAGATGEEVAEAKDAETVESTAAEAVEASVADAVKATEEEDVEEAETGEATEAEFVEAAEAEGDEAMEVGDVEATEEKDMVTETETHDATEAEFVETAEVDGLKTTESEDVEAEYEPCDVAEAEVVEAAEAESVEASEAGQVETTESEVVEAAEAVVVEATESEVVEAAETEVVEAAEAEGCEATEAGQVETTESEDVEAETDTCYVPEAEVVEATKAEVVEAAESEDVEAETETCAVTEAEVVEATEVEAVYATEADFVGLEEVKETEAAEESHKVTHAISSHEQTILQKVDNSSSLIAEKQPLEEAGKIDILEIGNKKAETFQENVVEMDQVHLQPPVLEGSGQISEVIAGPSCEVESQGVRGTVNDTETDDLVLEPAVEQASPLSVPLEEGSKPVCEGQSETSVPVISDENEMITESAVMPVSSESRVVADVGRCEATEHAAQHCEEVAESVQYPETVCEDVNVFVEDVEMVEECVVEAVETVVEETLPDNVSVPGEPLHSEGTESQRVEFVQRGAEMDSLHAVSEVTVPQDTMVNEGEVPMDTDCTETLICDNVIHESDQTDHHVETGASTEVPGKNQLEDSNPPLLEKVDTALNPVSESCFKPDISVMPSISELEQSQTVNGEESNSKTLVVSDQPNNSSDFKTPSGDPVKRSCKSPVCSSQNELTSQNQSPPLLSQGTSPNTSPNTSPSKGSVDRNVFSEFASNVNSDTKTSPSSSPGKTSPTTLNLPRGFAASLNKLKFKLPAMNKSTEDNMPEGSS